MAETPEQPEAVASIVAFVKTATRLVVIVKDAEVCPANTVTLDGTLANPLELLSDTTTPPDGAGAVRVTVACTGEPPVIEPTESWRFATHGGGTGLIVSVALTLFADVAVMAAMVWLLAGASGSPIAVIFLMTYLIAIAGSAHIVTGSLEAFLLVAGGDMSPWQALAGFALPALLGNIVGGTILFALLSHAQVMREI